MAKRHILLTYDLPKTADMFSVLPRIMELKFIQQKTFAASAPFLSV